MSARTFEPAERQAALDALVRMFVRDERIEALIITGSIGAQRDDRWSDIDLACLVADGQDVQAVASDWLARLYRELAVVHHYETSFDTTLVRGLLLANGLMVEPAFTPAADFTVWAPVRVAFDRTGRATTLASDPQPWAPTPDPSGHAGFAFHDVIHAVASAARGQLWRSLFYLQRIRNRALAMASERHGWDASEFARVDMLPFAEREPLLASLVAELEPATLLAAIDIATRALLAELERADPGLAQRLSPVLLAFIGAASTAVQPGEGTHDA